MDVTIQESRFSLRTRYQIIAPTASMLALKTFWSILPKATIFADSSQSEGGRPLAYIRRTSLFRSRYEFQIAGGATYQFARTSLWKSTYVCEGGGQTYEFFEHRGVRSSIFQNGQQIAALSKNRIVIGTGNKFDIQMNSDADLLLVACMVIAINTTDTSGDKDKQVVNVDLGNLGGQGRACDETWQPR